MGKVKVELDEAGIRELLTSPEVCSMVNEIGESKFHTLDIEKGYELRTGITHSSGKTKVRAFAAIVAVKYLARKENAENNTLLKLKG